MHLKRLNASHHYNIEKKERKFVTVAKAGPHKKNECIPLNLILRNALKIAETAKEVKKILNSGKVKVDGKIRKDKKYGTGIMDTIEIEDINKYYRIVPIKGKLRIIEIDKKFANQKLGKILNKKKIKSGKEQISLHDGRNIIHDKSDYNVGDSLMITVPEQKIKKHFKLEKNNTVIISSGKHTGKTGQITKVDILNSTEDTKVSVKVKDAEVTTYKRNVFVIGKDKPEIAIDESKIINN